MIVAFLPSFPFRGQHAPFLWIFYRLIASTKEPMGFILGKDYLKEPEEWKLDNRWEIQEASQERLQYKLPSNENLSIHQYKFLRSELFDDLLVQAGGNPLNAFKLFLTEKIPSLENEIEEGLCRFGLEKAEAVLTWCNCPSLKDVAAKFGIPVIHLELGPLRAPLYNSTAYLDFNGVNGNTEAKKRYLESQPDFNIDLKITDLREFFYEYKQKEKITPYFNLGVVLQVEDDSNLIAYGNGFDNQALLACSKLRCPSDKVLVRSHPGSLFQVKNGLFEADNSANSIEFIQKCKKILTINSSVGLEAILLDVPVNSFGDSSYNFVCETENENERINRLTFYLFAYLVPYELIFCMEYIRFRLSRPSEFKIVEYHIRYYSCGSKEVKPDENKNLNELIKAHLLKKKIADLEGAVSKRDNQISNLTLMLSEKEQVIKENDHLLAEREETINLILNSSSWRLTSPLRSTVCSLRNIKNTQLFNKGKVEYEEENILSHKGAAPEKMLPVDVIVPVYKGLSETKSCIENVLAYPQSTPFELIVIDDQSPEPELSSWLEHMAGQGKLTLHQNEKNLGFVGTVNRGMALHPERDVVLLNSDAIVVNDWLDRMQLCAYAESNIATVTPFSNNATICSYPNFCEDNELPLNTDLKELDDAFAKANRFKYVELPTGVGFCFYIRRAALNKIGNFDEHRFGKGYGEENDFCQRAIKAGWKNVLAADIFVQHLGGVSFGADQHPGKRRAMEVMSDLHPNYPADVHQFISADPIRPLRIAVDLYRLSNNKVPVILAISHSRGGGTQKHVDDLAKMLVLHAQCLLLRPIEANKVEIIWNQPGESLKLRFDIQNEYKKLVELLNSISLDRIHFHHLIGVPKQLWKLPHDLDIEFDFTAHDYYSICPQISLTRSDNKYCGERGISDCQACLTKSPAPGDIDIESWRRSHYEFLKEAARIFAPSADAATRLKRYFPTLNIIPVWHPESADSLGTSSRNPSNPSDVFKVVVIGALSQIKGADLLEACAVNAAKRGLRIKFELIGYAYRQLRTAPDVPLTVHGAYEDTQLLSLLEHHQPSIIWFPAQWPETYSYTLSTAFAADVPVLVPNLGAFVERITQRPNAWTFEWDSSPNDINNLLMSIKSKIKTDNSTQIECTVSPPSKFQYPEDYLSVIKARTSHSFLDVQFVTTHLLKNIGNPQESVHGTLVRLLHRLRAHPYLSWLAKKIPHATQKRVKNWLLGREKLN